MWGNARGWIIASFLAMAILIPVAWLARLSRIGPPTGLGADPANLAPLNLAIDPDEAWSLFTVDADGGPDYRRLAATWNDRDDAACAAFIANPAGQLPSPIAPLILARHDQRAAIFSADLPALINYDPELPPLDHLAAAGQRAVQIGLVLSLRHDPQAALPLEAAFALGRHLYRERIVFYEYDQGVRLMAEAAEAMQHTLPAGDDLQNRLASFCQSLSDYQNQRVLPIWQMISGADPAMVDATAGDVLAFAQNSSEPMWRVEATLKLGRYRFGGTFGQRIGAAKAIRRLAADRDPAVAAAANAAAALTIEGYRMIH